MVCLVESVGGSRKGLGPWLKVAVSTADETSTVSHRSRRRGMDSGETRETLHKGLKIFRKNHDKS